MGKMADLDKQVFKGTPKETAKELATYLGVLKGVNYLELLISYKLGGLKKEIFAGFYNKNNMIGKEDFKDYFNSLEGFEKIMGTKLAVTVTIKQKDFTPELDSICSKKEVVLIGNIKEDTEFNSYNSRPESTKQVCEYKIPVKVGNRSELMVVKKDLYEELSGFNLFYAKMEYAKLADVIKEEDLTIDYGVPSFENNGYNEYEDNFFALDRLEIQHLLTNWEEYYVKITLYYPR